MLKFIRKNGSKWYVTVPMCFVLLFYTSCTKEASKNSAKAKNYTGEELFRGLIFGEGTVAQQIPEITVKATDAATNSVDLKAISDLQDEIIANINTIQPDFLSTFKEEIQSGNRSLIAKALDDSRIILLKALQVDPRFPKQAMDANFLNGLRDKLPEQITAQNIKSAVASAKSTFKTALVNQLDPKLASNSTGTLNVNVNVAYAYAFAVAVAVIVVVIVVPLATDSSTTTVSADSLQKDQIVNSVANNLSVQ